MSTASQLAPEVESGNSGGGGEPKPMLAKVGSKYRKYEDGTLIPEGAAVVDLQSASKEDLEELYAAIAGTTVKKFRSLELALENVEYQISKMAADGGSNAPTSTLATKEKKAGKKAPSTYRLVLDASSPDKLKLLSPQARDCIGIMADFAKETGRFEFSESELKAYFDAAKDRLKTKQDAWRILMYYRSKLISQDLLRVS